MELVCAQLNVNIYGFIFQLSSLSQAEVTVIQRGTHRIFRGKVTLPSIHIFGIVTVLSCHIMQGIRFTACEKQYYSGYNIIEK